MSLPNPGMDFSPFATLPAASLDDLVENIEALATGSALAVSSITPEKLLTGTGTSWGWTGWTPTWTNLTLGNGTLVALHKQHGKTVNAFVYLTFGSTTSISGDVKFTLPVTARAGYATGNYQPLGHAILVDEGTIVYGGRVLFVGSLTPSIYYEGAAGNVVNLVPLSSTLGHTWAVNDKISFIITYEAA